MYGDHWRNLHVPYSKHSVMGRVPMADAETMWSLARTHVMMAKTSVLMTVPNTANTQISEKYLKNRFFLREKPAANTDGKGCVNVDIC